eukprot:XP_011665305.1 PREDICTED: uncharacterized protein LOC105438776 [Strongylocentrotus purpuratus]
MDAPTQSAGESTLSGPSDEQKVKDKDILKLAELLPPDRWNHLYVALCIDYSIADGIRQEFPAKTEKYIHLLQKWKAASTRTRKDLNAILIQVDSGGLVEIVTVNHTTPINRKAIDTIPTTTSITTPITTTTTTTTTTIYAADFDAVPMETTEGI